MPTKASAKYPQPLREGIEVFAAGFSRARSGTHPYEVHRLGLFWVLRDAPRKKPEDYRREEWIVHGIPPAEANDFMRENSRGKFCVSVIQTINTPDAPIRSAYKSLGYRLGSTESFMSHSLKTIPKVPEPFPIERVTTEDLADRVSAAIGHQRINIDDLADEKKVRMYAATDNGRVVGWATSIVVGLHTWVQGLNVLTPYRRRGIGKAILAQLLRDNKKFKAKGTYLTASHAGAMLYPLVGFKEIGQLLFFTPRRD